MLVAIPLAAIMLFSSSAQLVPANSRTPPVAQNAARSDDGSAQRRAADDGEVVSIYDLLVAMPHKERVAVFREQPSAVKAALWRHHLKKAEAEHPELSPEQRLIIEDFVALLTPDAYALSDKDPHWKSVVQDPLEDITRRAWAAFPQDLIVEIFLDMQPRDSATPRTMTAGKLHPRTDTSACNCSRDNDDCFFWEGSGSYCSLGCYWTSSWGCGPGWIFRCDGYCTPPDTT